MTKPFASKNATNVFNFEIYILQKFENYHVPATITLAVVRANCVLDEAAA